jgi:hypothetical protein
LSFGTCTSSADCPQTNVCEGFGSCNCSNPDYDILNPICSDEDCDNVCTRVCENERCVEDNSCEDDTDCFDGERTLCEAGECVQCLVDTDCDTVLDEEDDEDECRLGICVTPCKGDAECPSMHSCNAGTCEFVGCQSDRECILSGGAPEAGDPRLAVCDVEDGVGTCKIECELDAHCQLNEVCHEGTCEYIGCENDGECKSLLNLHNWESSKEFPWVPAGECREPVITADE